MNNRIRSRRWSNIIDYTNGATACCAGARGGGGKGSFSPAVPPSMQSAWRALRLSWHEAADKNSCVVSMDF